MFCKNCGNEMGNEEKICSRCGFSYDNEGQASAIEIQQPEGIGSTIGVDISNQKPSAKKTKLIIAIASGLVVLIVGGLILWKVLAKGSKKPKVDFEKVYSECSLEKEWATLGRDNSYLKIDTNPNNTDKDEMTWDEIEMMLLACDKIEEVNEYLGLPDYLYEDMEHTTALQGKQKETYEDIGVEVLWSYHPDNGLQVQYRLL